VNLVTATGSDSATVAALANDLAELTYLTQRQAAELQRLAGLEALAGISPPTHWVPGKANIVCGNGRVHTFERQKYKTKNNNYCWSHGYQVGADHKSSTCTKKKEGHNTEATKDNIMGGDTWGVELL
jgi:hypothetical protein